MCPMAPAMAFAIASGVLTAGLGIGQAVTSAQAAQQQVSFANAQAQQGFTFQQMQASSTRNFEQMKILIPNLLPLISLVLQIEWLGLQSSLPKIREKKKKIYK